MWPPSSPDRLFARATIASAFQRMMAERRCSISRLPGNCGCCSSATVFLYGVLSTGGMRTRRVRAWSRSLRKMKVARSGPSLASRASKPSSHSRVSTGSRSRGATRQCAARSRGSGIRSNLIAENPSERFLQPVAQLADHAAAECEHADDEDYALDDGDPGAQLREVGLQRDDDEGAGHRAED